MQWLFSKREACSEEGGEKKAVGKGDAAKKIWQLSQPLLLLITVSYWCTIACYKVARYVKADVCLLLLSSKE